MPGPDVGADDRPDLADRHLAGRPGSTASRRRSEPASASGPLGVGQVRDGDVDRVAPRPRRPRAPRGGSAPGRRCGPSPGCAIRPSTISSSGFTASAEPEQRGRGADPAAAPEVLQRVDVEQRRRARRPGPAPRPPRPRSVPPASSTSAAASTASPVAIPSCRVSTARTGHRRLPRRELGRLERCRSSPPTGGSRAPPRRRARAACSVGLQEHAPASAATCSPASTHAARRRWSPGSPRRRRPRRTTSRRSPPAAGRRRCRALDDRLGGQHAPWSR